MILICGLLADSMIELMCARLNDMGYDYLLFDERHYPGRCELTWEVDGRGVSGHVITPQGRAGLGDLTGVYARYVEYRDDSRPGDLSPHERAISDAEFQASVMALLDLLPCTVINRPKASTSNDSKVYQGALAVSCGLRTPRTLVTTDPDEARAFYEACGRRVIFKSLSSVRSIVRPLAEADLPRLDRLRDCPTQFQEQVGGVDIRVHTVGAEVYAAEIVSEASDYRYARVQGASLSGRPVALPPAVADSCLRLARGLGLELSGIDLRRTPDGLYYCFEINPSPGFIFFERLAGQPISEAVARRLRAG
jgi:glutathione synthase/RimK-type ligase-like ATP-grasp enzyme